MPAGEHSHRWEYGEIIHGMTNHMPTAWVERFCIYCYVLEKIELNEQ